MLESIPCPFTSISSLTIQTYCRGRIVHVVVSISTYITSAISFYIPPMYPKQLIDVLYVDGFVWILQLPPLEKLIVMIHM